MSDDKRGAMSDPTDFDIAANRWVRLANRTHHDPGGPTKLPDAWPRLMGVIHEALCDFGGDDPEAWAKASHVSHALDSAGLIRRRSRWGTRRSLASLRSRCKA